MGLNEWEVLKSQTKRENKNLLRLVRFPLGYNVISLDFGKFSKFFEAKIHQFDKISMELDNRTGLEPKTSYVSEVLKASNDSISLSKISVFWHFYL